MRSSSSSSRRRSRSSSRSSSRSVTIWTARRSYVGSMWVSNAANRVRIKGCGSEMLHIAFKWEAVTLKCCK